MMVLQKKLPISQSVISAHIRKLIAAKRVSSEGRSAGIRYFAAEGKAAFAPGPSIKEIHCNARQRKMPATECVFNDASPVCRACVVRPK